LKGCRISEGTFIKVSKNAELSLCNTFLGRNCLISSGKSIVINSGCLIAELVVIRDHNHQYNLNDDKIISLGINAGCITIEKNVWIGAKVTILKGVTIGENAVIGAHSLVNKNINKNSLALGTPARIIKQNDTI